MDVFTLYVGQGALAAARAGDEAVIVDAHMPTADHVTQEQIEESLRVFVQGRRTRGLIITGLDRDHAHPEGVDSILTNHKPDWVLYPKCYKDTDCASDVFATIERHEKRRARTSRPLKRVSVRLDHVDSRHLTGLAEHFTFELFSPHIEDMDSSNNSSIVVKVTGLDETGFSYLVTGDTETERWDRINAFFGAHLRCDVMAAPHHGSRTGVNPKTLLLAEPHTVLISAGVDNQYEHPHGAALIAYRKVATHVFTTNATAGGTCLFTRRRDREFHTHLVRHPSVAPSASAGA